MSSFEERFVGKDRITFAVVGDLHYIHRMTDDAPPSAVEYHTTNRTVSFAVLDRLKERRPDFVIHTGDIVEGHLADPTDAEAEINGVLDLFESIAPTFFAKGNHDGSRSAGAVYDRLMAEHHTRMLGRKIDGNAFAFTAGPARFVFTETFCRGREGEELARLEEELATARSHPRRFVVGHGPLYPAGRPYFTHMPFTSSAARLIGEVGVDAYFCGHTHNHLISLHTGPPGQSASAGGKGQGESGARPILQCKSALVGSFDRRKTVSLAAARHLASGGEGFEYLWGILEGGWPGWMIVTCGPDEVVLEAWYWASPSEATCGIVRWTEAGAVEVQRTPLLPGSRAFCPEDLRNVARAWLCYGGYRSGDVTVEATLNGVNLGALPSLGAFAPRMNELSADAVAAIRERNELSLNISSSGKAACIGGIQLVLELSNGEQVRSRPHPHTYTTTSDYPLEAQADAVACDGPKIGPIIIEF